MVQGKKVGKRLWKLSLFSVKCDLFLPSFSVLFYWLLLFFSLNQKQLLGGVTVDLLQNFFVKHWDFLLL